MNAKRFPWKPAIRVAGEQILAALVRLRNQRRDALESWPERRYVNEFFDCLSVAVDRGVPDEYLFECLEVDEVGINVYGVLNTFSALREAGFVDAMAVLLHVGVPPHLVIDVGIVEALTLLAYDFKAEIHVGLRGLLKTWEIPSQYAQRWVHNHNESIRRAEDKSDGGEP